MVRAAKRYRSADRRSWLESSEEKMTVNKFGRRLTQVALAGVVLLVSVCFRSAQAQTSNGTILGTVTDSSAAVVPNAQVTVKSIETGREQSVTTDSAGGYTIPNLQVGNYAITVSAPGYKTTILPTIELQVAQQAKVDAVLEVGQVNERVEVTASSTLLLNSVTSSVSQVIDTKTISSTPLNGRNFWQLTQLTPGVSYIQGGQSIPIGGTSIRADAVNVNVNGLNPSWTGWYLDGGNISELQYGGTLIQPNVDALQEFRVESGNMGAQYGHFPTLVNATLKSGTNAFHGVVYEFLRNNALDAKNYFFVPPAGSHDRDEPLHRNQFGYTLGGPIRRDKSFFFIDMQSTLLSQLQVFTNVVPSLAERGGDFAELSTKIVNPLTGVQFPGNKMPASSISSQAAFLLPYMPTPNYSIGTTSYASTPNQLKQQLDIGDIRIDQQLRSTDSLVGRYSISDSRETDPQSYPALGSLPLRSRGQSPLIRWTHTFNPKWINEAQVAYYRSLIDFNTSLAGQNFNDEAGIQGFDQLNTPADQFNFPSITIANYSNYSGGSASNVPKHNKLRSIQYLDQVTYITGPHSIRFGYENYHNTFMYQLGQQSTGVFTFNGQYSGDNFADFLLGYPLSVERSYFRFLYGNAGNLQSTYVQDDYRARSNLTLNLGLRWEVNSFLNGVQGQKTAYDEANNKLIIPSNANLNITPVSTLFPLFQDRLETTSQVGLKNGIQPNAKADFGPRIGFAYSPKPDWVVRSGYGIIFSYPDDIINNSQNAPPFMALQTVQNSTPVPQLTIGNFFQSAPIVAPNPNPGAPCAFGYAAISCSTPNITSVLPHLSAQYTQEWNLAVQHQFWSKVSLDVAYVGNKTTNILETVSSNDPTPGPGAIQARRPTPQWGTIGMYNFSYSSNYNALQTKLETRGWNGLSLLMSYTFARCLTDGSFASVTRESNSYAAAYGISYYGPCAWDLHHNLVISYLYQLPVGRGHAFLGNIPSWANAVVGDWQISGITTLQSGLPFTATISSDNANTGVAAQRPNISGAPRMVRKPSCWFYISRNTSCQALEPGAPDVFTVPAQYTYGNGGILNLRADDLIQFDFAALKDFKLGGDRSLEFRGELFNLFNRPTFAAPSNTNIDSGSGAQVSSTLNTSRIGELSLKLYF
jgi:hypothetical protein